MPRSAQIFLRTLYSKKPNTPLYSCCIRIFTLFSFFSADRVDEKLHRRTTVRMGIRVVQRALAPPSPRQFNLSGPSAFSTKDRSKRKTFGCKFGQEFKSPVPDRRTSVFQQQATIEENAPPFLPPDENRKPNSADDDKVVHDHSRHNQCEIHVNGELAEVDTRGEQMERAPSDHEVNMCVNVLFS